MNVDQIACVNSGGFEMKFRVTWPGGDSEWSDKFLHSESATIDLNKYDMGPIPKSGDRMDSPRLT